MHFCVPDVSDENGLLIKMINFFKLIFTIVSF